MIAQAIFTENYDDIKEAHRLEINPPEPILTSDTFGFHLSDVVQFHKTSNGNIRIYFSNGVDWTLKYDKAIWDKLLKQFDND